MAMQLRGLRTFCLVAQHLSFKKAADELCLSASAVSHQISDLEEELDVKLFERLTRSIQLTERGQHFYEEVYPHLDSIDEAALRLKKDIKRVPLLAQLPEFFASELLMPIITGFSERYQDIDLRIESTEIGNVGNADADINIVLTRKTPKADRIEKLFPIYYIPACSKALFDDWQVRGINPIDAIHQSTILLHKAHPHAWNRWARHAGLGNIKPKQIIYVDSMFALARAAQQGVGIALVPMPVSKSWFENDTLVPLHSSTLVTEDYYWMTLNEREQNREAASRFWNWMAENLQQYCPPIDELNSSVA